MGFFDLPSRSAPEPEPPERPRPIWEQPDAVIPGVLPDVLMLAHTDDAAIAVTVLRAYPTGLAFTLSAVLRRRDRRHRMLGQGMIDPARLADEPLPDEFLRVGLQFSDGSVVTNLDPHPDPGPEPTGPILVTRGGGGGGRRYNLRLWLWPLPPAGPMTFVCQWPACGIPESRAQIDSQPIFDAAARAVHLWPDDGHGVR